MTNPPSGHAQRHPPHLAATGPMSGAPAGNGTGDATVAVEAAPRAGGSAYVITVAAQRAGVHEQTLRHYERLGLISPARRGSRPRSQRLYSDHDVERVKHIRQLMDDLGVNLAGVETILNMRDRMEALRREMHHELARLRQEHEAETRQLRDQIARLRH